MHDDGFGGGAAIFVVLQGPLIVELSDCSTGLSIYARNGYARLTSMFILNVGVVVVEVAVVFLEG